MKSLTIEIGQRFGAWEVTGGSIIEKRGVGRGANYVTRYPCRCDCGTERFVRAFKLLGNSRSCGCMTGALGGAKRTRHGQNRRANGPSRLYRTWDGVVQRCTNARHESFARYGGRGISVCVAWRDFVSFAAWAAESGYDDAKQIDRIDNDGDYTAANCRWVSDAENKRNTSVNQLVTAFGETRCATDWALDPRCSVAPQTLLRRIRVQGWEPERAICEPRATRRGSPRFAGHHVKV